MNDKTSFLSLSITKVRKKMGDRLKTDLQLSNAPFREDDETTLLWKEYCNLHCTQWLNQFWQPVLTQLQKKPQLTNSLPETVDFVVEWVLNRFYSSHDCAPVMIKEVLQDLIKVVGEFFRRDKAQYRKMKNVVLINVIFLRIVCPWLLQMATSFLGFTPSGALITSVAIIAKVVFQIISQAINSSQSNVNVDPYIKSTAQIQKYPLRIALKKITRVPKLTPFDPRRHLGMTTHSSGCKQSKIVEKPKMSFWASAGTQLSSPQKSDSKVPPIPLSLRYTIQNWDNSKIQEFLFDHELYELIEVFHRYQVDGSSFVLLNDHTLRHKFGILRVAYRKRILKIVQSVQTKPSQSPPHSPKKDKDANKSPSRGDF